MSRLIAEKRVTFSRLPSFRAEHFPYSGPYPWLDQDNALDRITTRLNTGEINSEQSALCRHWAEYGYVILDRLFEAPLLDKIWARYEDAVHFGKLQLPPETAGEGDPHPGRDLNPHKKVGTFCGLLKHAGLSASLELLTGHPAKPLQTIASHKGTQQAVHSDSIHMTTYPLGYLTAAWIAFEDIHPDSGPLVYFPGSHKLPYTFSKAVGITEEEYKREGYRSYRQKYEPFIESLIEGAGLTPAYFHARKGDVLIWHANLLHGGSSRHDLKLTRKAVVCHFFGKGSFVYHDLAATRSKQQYLSTCLLRDEEGEIGFLKRKA